MTRRPRVVHLKIALACMMSALICQPAAASDFSIDGLWFETENYPASSVMRFSRDGEAWVGRYVQVSPPQKQMGFGVGETVIRGRIEGSQFVGQVLLKPSDKSQSCTNLNVGWVPIRMKFESANKLMGAWLQTWVTNGQACATVKQFWQSYQLERLPAQ